MQPVELETEVIKPEVTAGNTNLTYVKGGVGKSSSELIQESHLDDSDDLEHADTAWLSKPEDFDELEESLEALEIKIEEFESFTDATDKIDELNGPDFNTLVTLESAKPMAITGDSQIIASGGPLSDEGWELSMEKAINTQFDMAWFLTTQFVKLNVTAAKVLAKRSNQLAGHINTLLDDKLVNTSKTIFSTTINAGVKLPNVVYKDLSNDKKQKLINVVKKYTGLKNIGEKEATEIIEIVRNADNALDILDKIHMPKHSNLILPLFFIADRKYKSIKGFIDVMDNSVMPSIETNLSLATSELQEIIAKRDWAQFANYDKPIFQDKEKTPLYKLGKDFDVDVNKGKFKRVAATTYNRVSPAFNFEKKGSDTNYKYHQSLVQSVKDLEGMKESVISISDTLSQMSRKAETETGKLSKELRAFRASKSLKESVKAGATVNKYSNASYSRIMRELKQLATLSNFIANFGNDVITAYVGVFSRTNKLNKETALFIEKVTKILGE